MSNSNDNDGKREIKIYKKTYRLPMLAGGKFDQLQKQIRQRNKHLTNGRLVVEKKEIIVPTEEKRGIFSKKVIKHQKKIIEHETRKSLSFEERHLELNAIIQDYDEMVKVLKLHQYDYQKFFQELAQEIWVSIGENCNEILEKEKKRQLKEQQERQKANPLPQSLAMLSNMETQLFKIAKSTGYAAVLMFKKLDLMSESLQRIANDQDVQKQIFEEIQSQKDLYGLQLEINALQPKSEEFVDISLNFEEYMKPFMDSFISLLSNVATFDQELSKAMVEIQNIANLLEAQQFWSIESDSDSQRIADFLARVAMKKDRLQEALQQMRNKRFGAEFDAQLWGTDRGITIYNCLGNIRDFLDLKLDNLKLEVNDSDGNFYKSSKDVIKLDLGNSVILELVKVPAGKFMMGYPEGQHVYNSSHPQHCQVILQEFWVGRYAVTNAQWKAVMKTHRSARTKVQGDLHPVVGVSWHDAREFCSKVQQQTGMAVRLPTEAEWEYAARGANQSKGYEYAGSNNLSEVGWYKDNSDSETHPVGRKIPNELGIYDMSGNVWEWCLDEWHDSYENKPEDLKKQGNLAWGNLSVYDDNNHPRVVRGGSWDFDARSCHSASRDAGKARFEYDYRFGFRVLISFYL